MKYLVFSFKDPASDGKRYTLTLKDPKEGLTKPAVDSIIPKIIGVLVPDGCIKAEEPVIKEISETSIL